jgi:hypothetical protein
VTEKSQLVQIHHIKAHEGVDSLPQRGNDNADKMAKEFMAKAEEMKAAPYFTAYEEEIVLFHEDTLIEGDIRTWLKKHEVEKALNDWKAQPVAGKLIRKFPKQVPILAKEIWKSAIHCMDGVAWIYFIFAICHRLPTNLQKHKILNPGRINCNICQSGHVEDEEHLFSAPPSQHLMIMFERQWTVSTENGIFPTVMLGYLEVSILKKCGPKP